MGKTMVVWARMVLVDASSIRMITIRSIFRFIFRFIFLRFVPHRRFSESFVVSRSLLVGES